MEIGDAFIHARIVWLPYVLNVSGCRVATGCTHCVVCVVECMDTMIRLEPAGLQHAIIACEHTIKVLSTAQTVKYASCLCKIVTHELRMR